MDERKNGSDQDLPHKDQEGIEERAEESRGKLDDIPPHGTDPLHEGP